MKTMTVASRLMRKNILEAEFKMTRHYPGGFDEGMTTREAMLILQLKSYKDPLAVKARHKKLIIKNHPDKGTNLLMILFENF
jgi:hypothetical protein